MPVRKPGKLPSKTVRETYSLEYGADCLEMHDDAVREGQPGADRGRCAGDRRHGGGRRQAGEAGGRRPAALAFLIELNFLNGRAKLPGEPVYSCDLRYDRRLRAPLARGALHTGACSSVDRAPAS